MTEIKKGKSFKENTLEELQQLDIQLRDLASFQNVSINLTWEKIINLINYIHKEDVVSYKSTYYETIKYLEKKQFLDLTLRELDKLNIQLSDLFTIGKDGGTLNLTWDKLIKLVNYNANEKVISWTDTCRKAMETIPIFLA